MNAFPDITPEQIVARLRMIAAEPEKWCETDRQFVEDAADEIEDLRFQLEGTRGELELALSRERTLLREQDDCRIGADNLDAEIERLRAERDELVKNRDALRNLLIEAGHRVETLTAEATAMRIERDEARRINHR